MFHCETAEKLQENKFTIKVSGKGVKKATYEENSVRTEEFMYVVNKEITVEEGILEY